VTIPGRDGTAHHLIIGIGIVSVKEPKNPAVTASRSHAVGISVTDRPTLRFSLGYSALLVTSVAEGAKDVRVEVAQTPGGLMRVDAAAAELMSCPAPMHGK